MNNNINEISFKAHLVTGIKGQHGLIKQVGKKFAEKTAGVQGTLKLTRASKEIVDSDVYALNFNIKKDGVDYIISDTFEVENLLGKNLKNKDDVTPEIVDKISETFVNIFKALKTEESFRTELEPIEKDIYSVKETLRKNEKLAEYSEKKSTNPIYSQLYRKIAELNKKRLETLKGERIEKVETFLKKAKNIGKNDPYLDAWHELMTDMLERYKKM